MVPVIKATLERTKVDLSTIGDVQVLRSLKMRLNFFALFMIDSLSSCYERSAIAKNSHKSYRRFGIFRAISTRALPRMFPSPIIQLGNVLQPGAGVIPGSNKDPAIPQCSQESARWLESTRGPYLVSIFAH